MQNTGHFQKKILVQQGVHFQLAHRYCGQQYSCIGPNAIEHIDSYDEKKHMNGCIDGFSQHVMWTEGYIAMFLKNNGNSLLNYDFFLLILPDYFRKIMTFT